MLATHRLSLLDQGLRLLRLGGWITSAPVALLPATVVLGTLETLVGYVGSPANRAHARNPRIGVRPEGEEALRHALLGGRGGRKAKARYDPGKICGGEQAKAFIPADAVGPTDV
jgi:hypothetical protein